MDFDGASDEDPSISYSFCYCCFFYSNYCSNLDILEHGVFLE